MQRVALIVLPWIAASIAACGGGGTNPSVQLSGAWTFSVSSSNSSLQTTCQTAGSVTITQNGTAFTGTGTGTTTCNGPGGNSTTSGGATISGQITGSSVSFTDNTGCSYTGTVTGDPANHMSGQESCVVSVSGQNFSFTGTWQASR